VGNTYLCNFGQKNIILHYNASIIQLENNDKVSYQAGSEKLQIGIRYFLM
jgi:hypothetical protein